MADHFGAEIARSPAAWERLAKNWMVEVIERSPLEELDELPLGWIAHEAAPLIAEILGQLSDPGTARDLRLSPAARERAASLGGRAQAPKPLVTRLSARVRRASGSPRSTRLDRELPERDRREFTRAVTRLAEVFGAVQAAVVQSIAGETQGTPARQATGNAPDLAARLQELIAASKSTGACVAIAHFEIEGVERISKGYGEAAAASMAEAVAGVLDAQLAGSEEAFRTGPGQLVALLPGGEAADALRLAANVSDVVERSQAGPGPRVDLAVGLASFPLHADSPEALREAAEEAAWAARADGRGIAFARAHSMQDR